MPITVSFFSNKGGVGKITFLFHLHIESQNLAKPR